MRAILAVALLCLMAAPAAKAVDFRQVYEDYRTGGIDPCDFSGAQLSDVLGDIPTDIRAYDPGFTDAVTRALAQPAGDCSGTLAPDTSAAAAIPETPLVGQGQALALDGSPGPETLADEGGPEDSSAGSGAVPSNGLFTAAALLLAALIGGFGLRSMARRQGWKVGDRLAPATELASRAGDALWVLRDRFSR